MCFGIGVKNGNETDERVHLSVFVQPVAEQCINTTMWIGTNGTV